MGGIGSGRRPTKLSVDDCRVLDIGELCDGGALHKTPRGQIIWHNRLWPKEVALLTCRLAGEQWPHRESRLLLCYVYWPAADAAPQDDEVELVVRPGVRPSVLCPDCSRAARKLYAPPDAIDFSCRVCQGLIYPPSEKMRMVRQMQETLAPLVAELKAAREGRGPLPAKERLSPILEPQESRLACLRLRTAGLSLRQIAARVAISKSSVHRYLAEGPDGIDLFALASERRWRSQSPLFAGLRPAQELRSIHRWAVRRGFHRHSAAEHETRRLLREGADRESREILVTREDRDRCFASLREQGQQRLSQEVQARRKKPARR
jgi:hypothetical protein